MNQDVLMQLVKNTNLLPDEMRESILTGQTPSPSDLALHLAIAAMDSYVVLVNDPASTWNERRIARIAAAAAFLVALSMDTER